MTLTDIETQVYTAMCMNDQAIKSEVLANEDGFLRYRGWTLAGKDVTEAVEALIRKGKLEYERGTRTAPILQTPTQKLRVSR